MAVGDNNIAALMTPPGPAGIAVVQVKGAQAEAVVNRIFSRKGRAAKGPEATAGNDIATGRLELGVIYDGQDLNARTQIDQVIVAKTGQDTFEIHCHGGPRIVQRLMLVLQQQGVEVTTWQRLLSDRTIAEDVQRYLPLAKTETAVLAIAGQYPGGLNGKIREMITVLEKDPAALEQVRADIERLRETYPQGRRLLHAPTVVLTGPVNAGKSTLANALSGRSQSMTSALAGTTRDWTGNLVEMAGVAVEVIDTAGRRRSDDELERHALVSAEEKISKADMIVLVVEAGAGAAADFDTQRAELPKTVPMIGVVNKSDLSAGGMPMPMNAICVSAMTGENLEALREAIAAKLGFGRFDPAEPLVFTERQQGLLAEALAESPLPAVVERLKRLTEG